MAPVLFSIGPFNVYLFGFLLAVSFILSTFVIFKYAKEELKEEEYLDLFLGTCVITVFVARVVYIMMNFDDFGFNLLRYIVVRETPGLSLFGGSIAGFFFLYFSLRKSKYDFWHILDIFSVAGSVALIFIKLGEQMGGAGFGKMTNSFLGVQIIGQEGRYHPVELYEAGFFLLRGSGGS